MIDWNNVKNSANNPAVDEHPPITPTDAPGTKYQKKLAAKMAAGNSQPSTSKGHIDWGAVQRGISNVSGTDPHMFDSAFKTAQEKTGQALQFMDRGGAAVQAKIAGKPAGPILAHGQTPEGRDANRAIFRQKIGLEDPNSFLGHFGTYSSAPNWEQGTVDTFLDAITDPTSLAGWGGVGRKVVGEATLKGMPAVIRGFDKLRSVAPEATQHTLDWIGKMGAKASDYTTPGGKASASVARSLAKQTGSNETYQRLYALRNIYQQRRKEIIDKFGKKIGGPIAEDILGQMLQKGGFMDLGAQPGGEVILKKGIPGGKAISDFMKGMPAETNPYIQASNLGKATLFYQPLPHMRNISTLTALADPAALVGAFKKGGQLAASNIARKLGKGQLAEKLHESAIGGAERAGVIDKNVEQTGLTDVLSKLGPLGKGAAAVYKASGSVLWGYDKAAKAAVFETNLKRYKDPALAAYTTLKQMVDYGNQSPFIRHARILAPFATWRARMPEAVIRSFVENPQNPLLLYRASEGMMSGKERSIGGKERKLLSPMAEASELFDPAGIPKYIRGSLGTTARMTGDALQAIGIPGIAPEHYSNFYTYGKNPINYALSSGPLGDIRGLLGHGLFKESPLEQGLYDLTGVETYGSK